MAATGVIFVEYTKSVRTEQRDGMGHEHVAGNSHRSAAGCGEGHRRRVSRSWKM